jgi:hypothetical protein
MIPQPDEVIDALNAARKTTLADEVAELNAIDKAAADGIQKLVEINKEITNQVKAMITSDGSTASYYQLPAGATELQDLISFRNMNAQDGEIFRAIYRKGKASHSDELRDARKVLFYAQAEVKRLEHIKTRGW